MSSCLLTHWHPCALLTAHSHRPYSPESEAILTQFHSKAPPPAALPPPASPSPWKWSGRICRTRGSPHLPLQGDPLTCPCRETEPHFPPGRALGLGGPGGSQLHQPSPALSLPGIQRFLPRMEDGDGGRSLPEQFRGDLGGIWSTELNDFTVPLTLREEVGVGSGCPLPSLATGLAPGLEPGVQDRRTAFLGSCVPQGGEVWEGMETGHAAGACRSCAQHSTWDREVEH